MVKPVVVVLEVLGLLLVAAAAGVAAAEYVGLWAGLLAAAVVVLAGAVRGELMTTEGGSRGAAIRSSAPRR